MIKFFSHIKFNFNITLILFSALIFRLFLANFGTLQLDHGTFVAWANSLALNGFKTFYDGWSDYLPGYLYVLWFLGKVNLLIPSFQTILFKLPAILADLATGYLIYKIIGNKQSLPLRDKKGLLFSFFYLFNPAIFANSSLWGQVDSLTALFSLFSVFIFPANYLLSAVSLAVGTLIKPQAAFIIPAILYLFFKNKKKITDLLIYCTVGLLVFLAGFLPFSNTDNFLQFILDRLSASANQYPYGSVNAFSFWAVFGFWKADNLIFWIGLGISIILTTLITAIIYKKKVINGEYLVSGLSLLVTFLFLTRMHERHLLPALVPFLIASVGSPILLITYFGLSLTYVANLAYAYYWITLDFKEIFNPIFVKIFIITNVSLLVLSIVSIFKKIKIKLRLNLQRNVSTKYFSTKDVSKRLANVLLFTILLFSLLTRVYKLNLPEEKYFDEVYHAFTAGLILHNDPKAWEWWNPHPEGFAYEWTHPPLAKLGMTVGMYIFGENGFGWRVVQAILGTGSVFMVYLLSLAIFKDRKTALFSSFIFSLDGLSLVMSRIGMNDSYLLFFSLLSVYLFIKNKNLLSSIAFGLAIASKWSAIYVLPILFVSQIVFRKKINISLLSFLIFPVLIYVGSYSVMFATGHTWENFIEVQKQMWWYHTNLVAEHPYTSPAWSWPLLIRPIYLYDGGDIEGKVARIYAFGNPLVFWFGLFSIILGFVISAKEKLKRLGFVIFSYLIFFLPWIASPRIMFFYHYLPSIPYLAIASGFILRRFPKAIVYILVSSFLLFVYFYPHWIGLRIPIKLDESYYWFSSWR
jgi:Gpi18-like mannosyltransferase